MSTDHRDNYVRILEKALEVSEAQRGCIVVLNTRTGLYDIPASYEWQELTEPDAETFKRVIQQVFALNEPITTTNVNGDLTFQDGSNVVSFPLRSVICVPFRVKETRGAVYLDLRIKMGLFSNEDVNRLQRLLARYRRG